MEDNSQQLRDYVRQHLDKGISEAEIRAHLITHGWPALDVDQAMSQTRNYVAATPLPQIPKPPPPENKVRRAFFNMRRIIITMGVVVILAIAAAVYIISSSASKLPAPTTSKNAQDASRRSDASLIAYAVSQYSVSHKSQPQSLNVDPSSGLLEVCGVNCTEANSVTTTLTYYKKASDAVQFHSYSKNLVVPDADTVYIVKNATCKVDRSGIGDQTAISSTNQKVAILYALPSTSSSLQQCIGT